MTYFILNLFVNNIRKGAKHSRKQINYLQSFSPLDRIFVHITTYNNDRLSEEEAKEALEDAPIVNKPGLKGLQSPTDSWIDYLLWVEKLAGFRKPSMRLYLN
jgi:hypothetical protein